MYNGEEKRNKTIITRQEKDTYGNIVRTIIPEYKRKKFLTEDERKMLACLNGIYENNKKIQVLTQVAINSILEYNDRRNTQKLKEQIYKKSIDFVIYNIEENRIICCIELNGKEHIIRYDRLERDKFIEKIFKDASIKLRFIQSQSFYNQLEIRKIIEE